MELFIPQQLIKAGKIVDYADIDPTQAYVQIGVFQKGNRQNGAGNANAYAPYVIPLSEIGGSGTSYWDPNGNNIFNNNSGNVGIGTNTPTSKLHISGDLYKSEIIGGYLHELISTGGNNGFKVLDNADNTNYAAVIVSPTQAGLLNLLDFANGNAASLALNTTSADLSVWVNGGVAGKLLIDYTGIQSWGATDDNTTFAHQFKNLSGTVIGSVNSAGDLEILGFRMSTGASTDYILTCDNSGVATWQALPVGTWGASNPNTETDPLNFTKRTLTIDGVTVTVLALD